MPRYKAQVVDEKGRKMKFRSGDRLSFGTENRCVTFYRPSKGASGAYWQEGEGPKDDKLLFPDLFFRSVPPFQLAVILSAATGMEVRMDKHPNPRFNGYVMEFV